MRARQIHVGLTPIIEMMKIKLIFYDNYYSMIVSFIVTTEQSLTYEAPVPYPTDSHKISECVHIRIQWTQNTT
jgi:hypothetical protein